VIDENNSNKKKTPIKKAFQPVKKVVQSVDEPEKKTGSKSKSKRMGSLKELLKSLKVNETDPKYDTLALTNADKQISKALDTLEALEELSAISEVHSIDSDIDENNPEMLSEIKEILDLKEFLAGVLEAFKFTRVNMFLTL
jgi:hypothetical protein